jgi:hypothetical protein
MTVGSSYPGFAGVSDTPVAKGKGDAISTATFLADARATPVAKGTWREDKRGAFIQITHRRPGVQR